MSHVGPIASTSIDPNALRETMSRQSVSKSEKLERAGVQFEAIMIRQFLGDALKPSIKGSLDEDSSGNDTYRYFVVDTLSQSLAQQGVFGIGKQITQQLAGRTGLTDPQAAPGAASAGPAPSGTAPANKTHTAPAKPHHL